MADVTHILNAIEDGDPHAAEQLLPLVYDELRRLAAEKIERAPIFPKQEDGVPGGFRNPADQIRL